MHQSSFCVPKNVLAIFGRTFASLFFPHWLCRPEEIAATTPKLERCITDMDNWMSANRLKLNLDKTELLWAGTRYNMSMLNVSGPSLQLNNVTVNASQHVRVLGVPSFFGSESGQTRFQCQRDLLLSSVKSDASGGRLTLIRQ